MELLCARSLTQIILHEACMPVQATLLNLVIPHSEPVERMLRAL